MACFFLRFYCLFASAWCCVFLLFFLFAVTRGRSFLFLLAAYRTGLGTAYISSRLLGLNDASSACGAASPSCRWPWNNQTGTGHQTCDTEAGQDLLEILFFHSAPPIIQVNRMNGQQTAEKALNQGRTDLNNIS